MLLVTFCEGEDVVYTDSCPFQVFQLLDGSDTGMTVRVRVVRVTPLIYDESGHLASSPMTS